MLTDDLSWHYSSSSPFARAATFTHGGTPASIYVIFYRAGVLQTVGDMDVQNASPQARCRTSDVASASRGDTLAIGGTTYYVTNVEPLNNEETLLHLSLSQ